MEIALVRAIMRLDAASKRDMSLVDRLNEWYDTKSKLESAERGWKFGPSNLGDCLRKSAHILAGVPQDPLPPETARIFELGRQRGDALEAASKEIWPDAISQMPVSIRAGKFLIHGTCDLWIPSLRTIVDFKTQSTFGFGLLDTEGVSEDYQLQVHAYRDAIGLDLCSRGDNAPIRAVVIYESKDSDARKGIKGGMLKELEVPWTEDLEGRYRSRLKDIEGILEAHEAGTLNPKAYPELPLSQRGQKSWKCRYCSIGEERGGCYK